MERLFIGMSFNDNHRMAASAARLDPRPAIEPLTALPYIAI
jgi:hypothetical protein